MDIAKYSKKTRYIINYGKVFHGVMMDWQVYNTIEGMKEGADLRKMVILESIQEAMLVSSRSRDEIPQAQFEGAMDKLHTIKALAGNGVKAAGKYMKTLLAAGLLGASLTACAGGQVPQVDPMRTAEFSVQKDASMTDEQIAELGQECLLLIMLPSGHEREWGAGGVSS